MGPFWTHKGEFSSGILNSPQTNLFSFEANETIEELSSLFLLLSIGKLVSEVFKLWRSRCCYFFVQQLTTTRLNDPQISSVEDGGRKENNCRELLGRHFKSTLKDKNERLKYQFRCKSVDGEMRSNEYTNELLMNISWCYGSYGTTLNILVVGCGIIL